MRAHADLHHQEVVANSPANIGGYAGGKSPCACRTDERLMIEGRPEISALTVIGAAIAHGSNGDLPFAVCADS